MMLREGGKQDPGTTACSLPASALHEIKRKGDDQPLANLVGRGEER